MSAEAFPKPETSSRTPELDILKDVIVRAESTIQKEAMSTGQDWLTCYMSIVFAIGIRAFSAYQVGEMSEERYLKAEDDIRTLSKEINDLRAEYAKDPQMLTYTLKKYLLSQFDAFIIDQPETTES